MSLNVTSSIYWDLFMKKEKRNEINLLIHLPALIVILKSIFILSSGPQYHNLNLLHSSDYTDF